MKKIGKFLLTIFLLVIIAITAIALYSTRAIRKDAPVRYVNNLSGSIMAVTVPPLGIYIEKKYIDEGDGVGSILAHERIHWLQYQERGLWGFYGTYLNGWLKHGRLYNELEYDARNRSM